MNKFQQQLNAVMQNLDREHRAVVAEAAEFSDGSQDSFELELVAAAWEHPELPVRAIMDQFSAVDQ